MYIPELTVDMINLICAVIDGENALRESVITGIFKILPEVEDSEMITVVEKTVRMLENMSDDEFEECHFHEIMEA